MTFSYTTSQQKGITIFKLDGEIIDKNQTIAMMEEISKLISSGKKNVVLELSGVRYMNSSGLNVLVNILTKARTAGGDVSVCNLSSKVNQLLVVTKLDTIFHILPSVDAAVEKLTA
ncbi:MAG TPA: STAS domain-containing protein [Bacteroidia bacterium]|jgi:anti-sigma B factor antagonist|nr:STAS domain-containing protein [Bacteroidia bacterium]